MKNYVKLLVFCTFLVGLFSVPMISQAATAPGWDYENGSYTFYYVDNTTLKRFSQSAAIIEFTEPTVFHNLTTNKNVTFEAGLYYFANGRLNLETGSIDSLPLYRYNAKTHSVKQVLTNGKKTWYRLDRKAAKVQNTSTDTIITPKSVFFTGLLNGKVFYQGLIFSGVAAENDVYYAVEKSGKLGGKLTGVVKKPYVDITLKQLCNPNYKCYANGKEFTGIYDKHYYQQGVLEKKTGWFKQEKKIYYFKNGVAVTGSQYLPSYGGGSKKYRYTFLSDGTLNTDLLTNAKSSVKKQKMKIEVNITTHTITVLGYNSSTKAYDTPLKAFICSTSKSHDGTKTGNFNINRNGNKRWFTPAIAKGKRHYQWATQIFGSGALFHSEVYKSKNAKNFMASSYNGLGTNQTTYCVRMQAINAKLIYDIAAVHKGTTSQRIPVQIFRSSNKGAFGQVLLSDTTGKIPTNMKYDPTDPTVKKKK